MSEGTCISCPSPASFSNKAFADARHLGGVRPILLCAAHAVVDGPVCANLTRACEKALRARAIEYERVYVELEWIGGER